MNSYRVGVLSVGLMLSAIMLTGCGVPMAPASGTVTYNGKPVEGANITFISAENPSLVGSGITDAQGKFTLKTGGKDGVPLGKYNVGIAKVSGSSDVMSAEEAKNMTMDVVDATAMQGEQAESEMPAKYASPTTSGLTETIESGGSNNFTFDLIDGGASGVGAGDGGTSDAE